MHLDLPAELIPGDMILLTIDVPDDATFDQIAITPADNNACRQAGDTFLIAGTALGLKVPSIVVPQETNLRLNVRHNDMARVMVVTNEPFVFDPRLLA